MIKDLIECFGFYSKSLYSDFNWGTDITKNKSGANKYPFLFTEFPLRYNKTDEQGSQYEFSIILYSLIDRKDKVETEELNNINLANDLAIRFINSINGVKFNNILISLNNYNILTYSGVELNDFTDDTDGVRIELNIKVAYILC